MSSYTLVHKTGVYSFDADNSLTACLVQHLVSGAFDEGFFMARFGMSLEQLMEQEKDRVVAAIRSMKDANGTTADMEVILPETTAADKKDFKALLSLLAA